MILTVLGCSGSVPGPGTPCSGYLVEHDGHRLLLDLGTGAFGALLAHAAPGEVDTVLLSHRHSDHAADLAALAYAQARTPGRTTPTRVIAPAGTTAGVRRVEQFAVEDAAAGDLVCGPFRLRLARVRHSVETYAVRVEAGGRSLVYTGDSGPCRELAELARGTGLLLAEAALGPGDGNAPGGKASGDGNDPGDGSDPAGRWDDPAGRWDGAAPPGPHHLTAARAGELAALSGAALLAVTHVRPWEDAGRCLAAAAARFPGPAVVARPGLRLAPAADPAPTRTQAPDPGPAPERPRPAVPPLPGPRPIPGPRPLPGQRPIPGPRPVPRTEQLPPTEEET